MVKLKIEVREDANGNDDLPSEHERMIRQAANDASRMIGEAWRDAKHIYKQEGRPSVRRRRRRAAWRAKAHFGLWFGNGSLRSAQILRVRNRLHRIKKEFDGTLRITVIKEQSGKASWLCDQDGSAGTVSYCSPGTPIHLCPYFFQTSGAEENEIPERRDRASTFIHELGHKNGLIHRPGERTKSKAQELAREHPVLARANPYNIGYFAEEYF